MEEIEITPQLAQRYAENHPFLAVREKNQMTTQTTDTTPFPRRLGRSTAAVLVGFFACAILSLGTDEILHLLKVYPPWGESMWNPGLNALALAYRCLYTVAAGYITARLAPRNPMRHVWVLGFMGLAMAVAGVIGTSGMDLGPRWYPIALAVTSLPCVWLGGALHRK